MWHEILTLPVGRTGLLTLFKRFKFGFSFLFTSVTFTTLPSEVFTLVSASLNPVKLNTEVIS